MPKRKIFGRNTKAEIRSDTDEMRIYISPIFFIMALYFVATGMVFEFVCSLIAVLLHECAHAKVAKKLGYELNLIKLMPYGAALCGAPDMDLKHEVIISLAGPLFNIVIAVLFAALWWLLPSTYIFTQAFCYCNIYIGLFNLLPVYPLDGGRILLAALSSKVKRGKACKIMQIISVLVGLTAMALFALSAAYTLNLCLLSVGLFMIVSAFIPDKSARYRALFVAANRAERLKRPLTVKRFAVSEHATLGEACSALDPDRYSEFVVLDDGLAVRGIVTETDLIDALKSYGYAENVGNAVKYNGHGNIGI